MQRQLEGEGDDADVQPGDGQNVRKTGGGESVARVRGEFRSIGNEQRADERRIAAEGAIDVDTGAGAPTGEQRRPTYRTDRCVLHEDAALRRAHDAARVDHATRGGGAALDGQRHTRAVATVELRANISARRNAIRDDDSQRLSREGVVQATRAVAPTRGGGDRTSGGQGDNRCGGRASMCGGERGDYDRRQRRERPRSGEARKESGDVRDEEEDDERHAARSLRGARPSLASLCCYHDQSIAPRGASRPRQR